MITGRESSREETDGHTQQHKPPQPSHAYALTSGPKAMIFRMHSSVKRAVKMMFRYFSMDSYRSGAP
ncbi:hypothetical protein EYF80_030078 [Liparis tanakae]|uniref:Uncharacterized protein n=1 Tax=Liparis tanakae TaxID=230148 RepID=A0A4Z2H1E8_9TELE|nr:hypothetical protein EYF80_030078 [Liparis tanakae]